MRQNDKLRNDKCNDKKAADVFSPGDLVYIKHIPTTETNAKLQARFTGPYRLIEMIAENIFYVESLTTGKLYRTHARRAKMAHPETLQGGEHPNLNRSFPTFIDLVDEEDGLTHIEPAKMITEVMTTSEEKTDVSKEPTAKWEITYTNFGVTHPIWNKPDTLHIIPIDALELGPKEWIADLCKEHPFLNVYAKRTRYRNTNYAKIHPNPEMGSVYYERRRNTRNTSHKPHWVLIMCTMTHRLDKTNTLLCSNILDDEYKQLLSRQNNTNVQYWLHKGMRLIPNKVKGTFLSVVLHVPHTFPMAQKDIGKVEGLLKNLSDNFGGMPILNHIEY